MTFRDFISKTASDALGRGIAAAPASFARLITSTVWVKVKIDETIYTQLEKYLKETAVVLWAPTSKILIDTDGKGRHAVQTRRDAYQQLFLVRRRFPVLIDKEIDSRYVWHYNLSYPRGFNPQPMLDEALIGTEILHGGWLRSVGVTKEDTAYTSLGKSIKPIKYWSSPALQAILRDGKQWFNSADLCVEKGIPWRRGWLLHGPPGNGKSSAVQILAYSLGVNLMTFNLNVRDTQFELMWREVQNSAPCIVLLEDIDAVFHGRKNVKNAEHGVSFSTLINAIDGANSTDGVAVAITTNDLGAIDPALGRPRDELHWNQLSTRPGRLDRCIRFDNPDFEGRLAIGKMLLPEKEVTDLARQHDDVSLVQFQAICRERAFANLNDDLEAA